MIMYMYIINNYFIGGIYMKAFLFSYGGNNDMGDLLALGDYYKVDFLRKMKSVMV